MKRSTITFAATCPSCGRRFSARTTTVVELQVEDHLAKDGCQKKKPPAPQNEELFKLGG